MKAYLSGPIENAENDGADWRISITNWLKNNLSHSVFNPVDATQEITKGYPSDSFREMMKSNPDEYKKLIRKIIDIDIDAVINKSDYLIVNWEKSVFRGGGTHGEITMAYHFK